MKDQALVSDTNPDSKRGEWRLGLLFDAEVEALKPLLRLICRGFDRLIDNWYTSFAAQVENRPSLSRADFNHLFQTHLGAGINALLAGRTLECSNRIALLGGSLARRGVPLAEILLSLRVYEECVAELFSEAVARLEAPGIFSKLSSALQAALAESYVRSLTYDSPIGADRFAQTGANEIPINAIVGNSTAVLKLRERIKAAANVRGTILLVGESGTGKELVAGAIHRCSPTPDTPFIAVNCAAIPRELIESELFGYKKGAFSGANSHFLGLFRSAQSGTLFLDEVTEMSPDTQSKILRALQERTVRPLGSTSEIPIDVRLVASTNRDPEEAVRSGQLRQDLYYRLQAGVLYVPPLRERLEDIPLLVEHFIGMFNARMGRPTAFEGIQNDALQAMLEYPWPGNVRELSNAVETAMTFGQGPLVALEDLPAAITRRNAAAAEGAPTHGPGAQSQVSPQFTTLEASERELVARALAITGGNKTRAAKLLQISRKKLYSLTTKYMLEFRQDDKL